MAPSRRTPLRASVLISALALATLPAVQPATALHGEHAIVDLTFRGNTAWLSSAQIATSDVGVRELQARCGTEEATALATHPTPPIGPSTFDLTDTRRLRVQDCDRFVVRFGNGPTGTLTFGDLGDGPLLELDADTAGLVRGTSSTDDAHDTIVTLTSGDQVLTRTVNVGTDGTWEEDFSDEFDGTWEFGASVTSVLRQEADGTTIDLRATRRLPSADVVTHPDEPNPIPLLGPIEQPADITISGITPALPFSAFGEPSTFVSAVRTYGRTISGGGLVSHLGQEVSFAAPDDHVVADCDLGTATCTGTSTPDATIEVTAVSDVAFVEDLPVVVNDQGDWTVDLAPHGFADSTVIRIHATLAHTDGARYHATDAFGDGPLGDGTPGPDVVVDLDAADITIAPLPGANDAEWTVSANTGATTHTATGTKIDLAIGLGRDDFDPPLDVSAGYLLTIDDGAGSGTSWEVSELSWAIADSATGRITAEVDPEVQVDVFADLPIYGVLERIVTSSSGGDVDVTLGAPATPGSTLAVAVGITRFGGDAPGGVVIDTGGTAVRDVVLGADGGRAVGLGDLRARAPRLLDPTAVVTPAATPTWRYDLLAGPGGADDLRARYAPRNRTAPLSWHENASPASAADQVRVLEGTRVVRRPAAEIGLYVPFTVERDQGAAVDPATVHVGYLADGDDGWETVATPSTLVCLDATVEDLDPRCAAFPMPFVVADDIAHLSEDLTDVVLFTGNPAGPLSVTRVAGEGDSGRIGTAIAVSQDTFETADAVVLARADDFADALSAASLAAAVDGPILLNPTEELRQEVSDEIDRLGATTVYLAGGEGVLSPAVFDAVDAKEGVTAERLAGGDRYATSELIARTAVGLFGEDSGRVLVALGSHPDPLRAWPDALAAGQLAAHAKAPILLVDRDRVPEVISSSSLIAAGSCPCRLTAIGGTGTLPAATFDALAGDGRTLDRIAGSNRFATSLAVARAAIEAGAVGRELVIATGGNFPDGLPAAAAAAHRGGIVLLVPTEDLAQAQTVWDWLLGQEGATRRATVTGGPGAVSDQVLQQVQEALDGTTRTTPAEESGGASEA